MSAHQFLWLDLETTGLDPDKCRILEWAAVLANDGPDGDMSAVEEYTGVIGFGCSAYGAGFKDLGAAMAEMDPFVVNMHTKNGLIQECTDSTDTLEEAESFLLGLAAELGAPRSIILAGASVHFDLSFLRVHMPRFAELLSHRCFDVSTLKMAEQSWAGAPFAKAKAHRALPDILESLQQAAVIRAARWAK